jgi:hypothetical protein
MVEALRSYLLESSTRTKISLSTLFHEMRQAYSAFLWEWKVKGQSVDLESFEEYRAITIFNQPWIELWKVLSGIELELILAANLELVESERLAAEITYLVNDLTSLKQDIKKNKQNLIFIMHAQRGLPLEDAAKEVRKIHDQKVDRFIMLSSKLEAENPSAGLHEYMDLLKSCIRGNIQVIAEFKQRYDLAHKQ